MNIPTGFARSEPKGMKMKKLTRKEIIEICKHTSSKTVFRCSDYLIYPASYSRKPRASEKVWQLARQIDQEADEGIWGSITEEAMAKFPDYGQNNFVEKIAKLESK